MSGDVLAALARALRQARANRGSEQRGARILFDVLSQDGWRLVRRATTDRERLTPRGPLVPTDLAVIVVREGRVAIVRSRGAPPSVMPPAMVRDLVYDMAAQALADLTGGDQKGDAQ